MLGALAAVLLAAIVDAPVTPIGPGVSEALAREGAEVLGDVRSDLAVTIPSDRRQPVHGRVVVRATLDAPHRIVLDFDQPRDHVASVRVDGVEVPVTLENGHLVVADTATRRGENT